jgi:hypothetical protein
MCIRERLRAVSTVRQCAVGLARSTCPCPLGGPPIATGTSLPARTIKHRRRRRGVQRGPHYPTHADMRFDEQNPVVAQCEAISVFLKQLNIN